MEPTSQLVFVAAGGAEPLLLTDAKNWLRIDAGDTGDDSDIAGLCIAARSYAEMFCRRSFKVGDAWKLTMDRFPGLFWQGLQFGLESYDSLFESEIDFRLNRPETFSIRIPKGSGSVITSIQYVDTTGTTQTLDPSVYELVPNDIGDDRVYPTYGNIWPVARFGPEAVTVNFTTGKLPPPVLVAIKQIVGTWYQNREGAVPLLAQGLLRPYRDLEF